MARRPKRLTWGNRSDRLHPMSKLDPVKLWVPSSVATVVKLGAAKMSARRGYTSILRMMVLLIFDRDADAWQAVHDARQELGV